NWLCGRFCVQASSFENYIAEKPFTDRFVQQSRGGLQFENGDPDLALVLHPRYWGLGKKIFKQIVNIGFNEYKFNSITILLPPSRNKLKAIYLLGFKFDGEVTIDNQLFIRYRLYKPN
ncbi:hypothetical protein ACG93U_15155, partial [Acinetobacter haemolyticus]